jgi:hypothetical protein
MYVEITVSKTAYSIRDSFKKIKVFVPVVSFKSRGGVYDLIHVINQSIYE